MQLVSLPAAFALIWIGASIAFFAICGMVVPRRFHTPLTTGAEIVSPLMLVGDRRVEGLLGVLGLLCVLTSIAIDFVRLYT